MMSRTTLNIDGPVLEDLKRLQRKEKKPLGRLVSDMLAKVLGEARAAKRDRPALKWTAVEMRAKVDLEDKEAVYAALESDLTIGSRGKKSRR